MSSDTLLSATPLRGVSIKATGLEEGGSIKARVGLKNASWVNRGSNDGATSEDAPESGEVEMGWLVYNTFRRDPDQLEVMLRVMTRSHAFVGKEIMGEVKVELRSTTNKEVKVLGVTLVITIGDAKVVATNPVPPTHPCGTNHFGMLPYGIDELTQNDLKGCTLWGSAYMPMTSWVACHLLYHDKPFRPGPILVKSPLSIPKVKGYKDEPVPANTSGAKAGYGVANSVDKVISNAVPMLEIKREDEEEKRLIADGVIINYLIIPLLYPQKITEEVLRWERKIGYELVPAMWRETDGGNHADSFARTCPNYPSSFTSRYSPLMRMPIAMVSRNLQREMDILKNYIGEEFDPTNTGEPDNKKLATMKSIFTDFKTEMGQQMGKQDFMGGEKPNPTDVSFYGINIVRFVTHVGPTRALIEEVGLLPWMYRMMDLLPPSKCLDPKFFGPAMEGWKAGWLMDPPQPDPVQDAAGASAPAPAAAAEAPAAESKSAEA